MANHAWRRQSSISFSSAVKCALGWEMPLKKAGRLWRRRLSIVGDTTLGRLTRGVWAAEPRLWARALRQRSWILWMAESGERLIRGA